MSNGDTLTSIERILTGKDELPERVSNTLLLAAIRANYQNMSCITERFDELEHKQLEHGKDIEQLQKRSDRWDLINSIVALIGGALGIGLSSK